MMSSRVGDPRGEDVCGIWKTRSAPKQKHMVHSSSRMSTFASAAWPASAKVRPKDLAKAGFFYLGIKDFTKCFHCEGGLCRWEKGDDAWIEHARWYPECEYVLLSKGDAFIKKCTSMNQVLPIGPGSSVAQSPETAATSHSRLSPKLQHELDVCLESPIVRFYLEKGTPLEAIAECLENFMIEERRGFGSYQELSKTLFRGLQDYLRDYLRGKRSGSEER